MMPMNALKSVASCRHAAAQRMVLRNSTARPFIRASASPHPPAEQAGVGPEDCRLLVQLAPISVASEIKLVLVEKQQGRPGHRFLGLVKDNGCTTQVVADTLEELMFKVSEKYRAEKMGLQYKLPRQEEQQACPGHVASSGNKPAGSSMLSLSGNTPTCDPLAARASEKDTTTSRKHWFEDPEAIKALREERER